LFRRTEASRDLSGHPAERNSAHDSAAGPGDGIVSLLSSSSGISTVARLCGGGAAKVGMLLLLLGTSFSGWVGT